MVARSVVCPTSQAVPVRLLNPREESVVVRTEGSANSKNGTVR